MGFLDTLAPRGDCRICSEIVNVFRDDHGPSQQKGASFSLQEISGAGSCDGHSSFISTCITEVWPRNPRSLAPHARVKVNANKDKNLWVTIDPLGDDKFGMNSERARLLPVPTKGVDLEGELLRGTEYARTVSRKWIDGDLLRQWRNECDEKHAETCGQPLLAHSISSQRPTWLVDVSGNHLSYAQTCDSYVALSYVWGAKDFLTTTQSTLEGLQKPGALLAAGRREKLPRTIWDAMELVRILGLQFLWVDALCIVQDDPAQKHRDITNMAGIYANASLTVLATQGEEADSGLKGISTPRSYPFQSVRVSGQHECFIKNLAPNVDSQYAWENRGWTYQESLMSSRGFVFENDTVSWQCRGGKREECLLSSKAEKASATDTIGGWRLSSKESEDGVGNFQIFVFSFNSRLLTYPEDALFAFKGIASVVRKDFVGGFLSGLPTAFFDTALLWDVNQPFIFRPYTRRTAKRKNFNSSIPSWSWAGWQCNVDPNLWPQGPEHTSIASMARRSSIKPLVNWHYHLSISSDAIPINSRWYEYEAKYFDSDTFPCPPGWTRTASKLNRVEHLRPRFRYHFGNVDKAWQYPIPFPTPEEQKATAAMIMAPFISCTTRRGWLFLDQKPDDKFDVALRRLRDVFGRQVGKLRPHPSAEDPDPPLVGSRCELIEIARGYSLDDPTIAGREKPFPYFILNDEDSTLDGVVATETYYVMCITWENGIAYRQGIGEVRRDLWEEQDLELIPVMLG